MVSLSVLLTPSRVRPTLATPPHCHSIQRQLTFLSPVLVDEKVLVSVSVSVSGIKTNSTLYTLQASFQCESLIKCSSELLHKQRGDGLLVVSNITLTFLIIREEARELHDNIHHNTKLQSKQSGQSAAALIIMQTFSIFSPNRPQQRGTGRNVYRMKKT